MNSKKDSKRSKTKQQVKQVGKDKNFQSPIVKKITGDSDQNPMNLRDLSPYPAAIYGSYHTPNNIHFSNTELTIIETPAAHTFPRMSYLEQIDEAQHSISGIINWENQPDESSINEEEDSEILQMLEQESKKSSNNKQNQESDKKPQQKKFNSHLRTAEPKQKKDSNKKNIQNTNSSTNGSKKVFCNCKKTKCLKLYCDCFRINQNCDGCNCVGCHNLPVYQQQRNNAMLTLMDRNPQAFKPKIDEQQHAKGCHCKKSNCLKKYCECFQAGLKCGDNCKCEECKNRSEGHNDKEDENNSNLLQVSLQFNITNQVETKQMESKERRLPRAVSAKDRKIQQWAIQA